jgi:hypothetical protein
LTLVDDVVPMRQVLAPAAVTLSENCTNTESFSYLLPAAFPRSHSR